jgi:DNA-binding XRE family transcriptional regulator
MYPNLMGQKVYRKLTAEQMGHIIGLSRQSYEAKMESGRFTPEECKAFCRYFGKSFDFLFATDEEIAKNE